MTINVSSKMLPWTTVLLALLACDTNKQVPSALTDSGASTTDGDASTTGCSSDSAASLRNCVSQERFATDLARIAQPRPPGSSQWQAVQDLCALRFESLGYSVERQSYGTGTNVIGTRGTGTTPAIVISAHYDSVTDCPGADDNASGVAGLLEVARVLATASFDGRVIVACWDEEERGCLGSQAYVRRAVTDATTITGAFVFDMIGYFSSQAGTQTLPSGFDVLFPEEASSLSANSNRADFIFAAADEQSASTAQNFVTHATEVGLPSVELEVTASLKDSALVSSLGRSDHASFWLADYPAIFVTDTADFRNSHYHCGSGTDAIADVDLQSATRVVKATVGAVANELGL